jgi:hypothetical protein
VVGGQALIGEFFTIQRLTPIRERPRLTIQRLTPEGVLDSRFSA